MTETYINHGELLTQSLRDVKANFLAIMETLPECFVGKCPFDIVLEVMEQLGFEELEHETNGWDLDYWATFTKGNLTYSVDGSHYYCLSQLHFHPSFVELLEESRNHH